MKSGSEVDHDLTPHVIIKRDFSSATEIWPGSGSGVLALLLMYYLTCVATKTTPDNVANLYASELGKLPWRDLKPDLQLLETMTRVWKHITYFY